MTILQTVYGTVYLILLHFPSFLMEIRVIDEEDNLISHCKLSTFSRPKK